MKHERHIGIFIASIALAVATHAYAHVGAGEPAGFIHGFVHPFDGIDHLLIMVAVGLCAARLPHFSAAGLAAGAALLSAYLHGSEIPSDAVLVTYVAGFLSGTVLLQLVGVGIGVAARMIRRRGTQSS